MTPRTFMLRLAVAVAMAMSTAAIAQAQVRFRRPLGPAPVISYGYDNNGGASGCRDYTCGSRCYDGHTGTDIPVPLGTTVLAGAAGSVVATNDGCANYGGLGNTCGGRCGNYVQLQHADGTRTIYCHMQQGSLMVGRGQSVGCGQAIGRSASSGSSTGPHLHFGWQRGGVSLDPFTGGCSNGGGRWVNQGSYPSSPGDSCEGPPPPPPCTRREGPFGWNCSGPIAGMTCTLINEPADPHTWGDNYFCSDLDRGLRWSYSGPIAGMRCVAVNESSEPASHTWGDNFLCAPSWLPYTFRFGSAGPIAGMSCVQWTEPGDPHTWGDNFLCWTRDADCVRRSGPFAWSCSGPQPGMTCTQLNEPADPHTWGDNFLCAERDVGLRWSSAGAIAGMTCTAISEGSEPAEHTWGDNFLCAPRGSEYAFRWSTAGPIAGYDCLAWYEPADPHTWEDNFLCWRHTPAPRDAGTAVDAGTRDAGATPDIGSPRDAGSPRDVAPATDIVDVPAEPPRDAAADAPLAEDVPASIDDLPLDDVQIEDPLIELEPQPGCGCRTPGRGGRDAPRGHAALLLSALALALRPRRRAATPASMTG